MPSVRKSTHLTNTELEPNSPSAVSTLISLRPSELFFFGKITIQMLSLILHLIRFFSLSKLLATFNFSYSEWVLSFVCYVFLLMHTIHLSCLYLIVCYSYLALPVYLKYLQYECSAIFGRYTVILFQVSCSFSSILGI